MSKLNAYIHFKDNARDAMTFYQTVFGGQLALTTFGEGMPTDDPTENDKIMHAALTADNGISFFGADTPNSMDYKPGAVISLSLSGDNEAELKGYFEKLADGGSTSMPLDKAPWGDYFGMCTDKYGIDWMVNISAEQPAEAS